MNFSFLPQFWSYFNYGVLVTIMISVCVVFFGTILGVLVSLAKRSGINLWSGGKPLCLGFPWDSYGCTDYDCF